MHVEIHIEHLVIYFVTHKNELIGVYWVYILYKTILNQPTVVQPQ